MDESSLVLAKLGPGEIFGESALLFNEPRSASAYAETECELIEISREIFNQKLTSSDPTVRAIVKMLARRILESNETLIREQRDIRSLIEAARILYENVAEDLPEIQQRLFEEGVRPKFEEFLEAIEMLKTKFDGEVNSGEF
jgi:CRP-like cAMP-binding protein